jgi:hypothetical protein
MIRLDETKIKWEDGHIAMNKLNISEFCSVRRGVPFMIISALLTSSGNASNALIND